MASGLMADGDWTTPGVYEVADGVHRIPLPLPNDGLRAVNVYAVVDGNGLVLIDSGWAIPEARQLLGEGLEALGCSVLDIHRFLITHVHRDHYTEGIEIRREVGTRVSLGEGERASLDLVQEPGWHPLGPQLDQLRRYGAGQLVDQVVKGMLGDRGPEHSERMAWEYPDDWLEAGELLLSSGRHLEIVETPGHTRGHVVFHDAAAKLLFAGDHVLPTITPSIGFEPVLSPNPLGDFLGSLAKVRTMPDAMLLPAHGPVAPSVHTRIDELVEHHGRRLEQTQAAVELGASTAYEAAGELRWTRRAKALSELDWFNQMLAVAETGAHLVLLEAQGRVSKVHEDGLDHYAPL
ncbi:MAG: MBL fold metallo-hydrolase [Actinobacteria bacterium]|nr:MBL fold metallo-hydrolase [Actinomycetota bacterium]